MLQRINRSILPSLPWLHLVRRGVKYVFPSYIIFFFTIPHLYFFLSRLNIILISFFLLKVQTRKVNIRIDRLLNMSAFVSLSTELARWIVRRSAVQIWRVDPLLKLRWVNHVTRYMKLLRQVCALYDRPFTTRHTLTYSTAWYLTAFKLTIPSNFSIFVLGTCSPQWV